MAYLVEQLFNALMLGSMYGLVAIGFSMIYGVARLMNFAHGELFMAGAYGGMFVASLPWWKIQASPDVVVILALLAAAASSVAIGALIGVGLELIAYRQVRKTSRMATFLVAVGASIFLQHLGFRLFTASPRGFPSIGLRDSYSESVAQGAREGLTTASFVMAPEYRDGLIVALLLAALIVALWFTYRTDTGLAVRAVSLDEEAARSLGIRDNRAVVSVFALGGALAGIAGFLWALRYGGIQPLMGFIPGIKAFVAAVVGGFGSLSGALLGGMMLGFLETLSFAYLPGEISGYRDFATLLILLVFLLVRPQGILGTDRGERA